MKWRKTISGFLTSSGFWTAAATIVIATFTIELYCVSNHQWQTMKRQLDISERPWISLDKLVIVDPLTFKEKGGFITIGGILKNTGHSVAVHTQFRVRIIDNSQFHTAQENDTLCGRNPVQSIGDVLFPGDRIPVSEGAEFYPVDIQSAQANPYMKGKVSPVVIVCITYQFSFEPEYHLTQYVFDLGRPLNEFSWQGYVEPKGTPEGLQLIHSFIGNSAD